MWKEELVASRTAPGELFLKELLPDTATCGGGDPGPDPTWDPDELPLDDEAQKGS